MARGKSIPIVSYKKSMKTTLGIMSKKKLGIVCIKEKNGKISLITDGDIRRNANNLYKS